jgi:hypothetical protein
MKLKPFLLFFFLLTGTWLFAQQDQVKRSKISPGLSDQFKKTKPRQEQVFIVSVQNSKQFQDTVSKMTGITIVSFYEPARIYFIKTSFEIANRLLQWNNILFIDISRRPTEELFTGTIENATNLVNKMQSVYPVYNGNTITIGIKENSFDTSDIDFRGRYLVSPLASQNITAHASVMATIAAGGGNTWYATKGAAWASRIISSSFTNLLPDANNFFQQNGITVQNHSYGIAVENYYGAEAMAYDLFAFNNPSILHVFSSGNSGNLAATSGIYNGITGFANLTGNFKMAKNILTVGATDSFYTVAPLSSKGPGFDGRVKPELVALGEDGSSGAAAIVSGVAGSLQHAYKTLNSGNLAPSSLIRAVLINSADDIDNAEVDYRSGYGSLNAYKAMKSIVDANYITGSVAQSQEFNYSIDIPAGIHKIKVSLDWTDPPATVNSAKALVNDLDIELIGPSSQVWLPWVLSTYPRIDSLLAPAKRKRDSLNTIEQITLNNPAAGNYTIKVNGFNVTGSQSFSIVWQMDTADNFEWNFPAQNDPILGGGQNVLRWQSTLAQTTGNLQFSTDNGNSWQNIANAIDLSMGYFKWNAPLLYSKSILRMIAGPDTYSSDTFVISKALSPSVGFNCADSFMLYWPRINGISQYDLYNLPGNYLNLFQTRTDTSIVIQKSLGTGLYYAVTPVIGNREGVKSFTINYTLQGVQCFIKSFFAEKTGNAAQLHLELGALYGISKIIVQKIRNGDTSVLQTVNNPGQLIYSFTDNALFTGLQQYRIWLETSGGSRIYSDIAPLYFAAEDDLFVFPNPVKKGTTTYVVLSQTYSGELQLMDMFGKIIQRWPITTDMIPIPTERLQAGIYLLRVAGFDKKIRSGRVIVF